jgi:hypothetical protein
LLQVTPELLLGLRSHEVHAPAATVLVTSVVRTPFIACPWLAAARAVVADLHGVGPAGNSTHLELQARTSMRPSAGRELFAWRWRRVNCRGPVRQGPGDEGSLVLPIRTRTPIAND